MPLPTGIDGRLILEPARPGPWNMAVDQVLLENANQGELCLRFYAWSGPVVSLGYFQRYEDRHAHAASLDCALVRRASGGGALIHGNERQDLTYSVAVPGADPARKVQQQLYETFHGTLIEVLNRHDVAAHACPSTGSHRHKPFLCFHQHTRGDVMIGPHKVTGSAQRRLQSAVLQHGSVLLDQSSAAPELAGIRQLASVALDARRLSQEWIDALIAAWPVRWHVADLSADERRRVEDKVRERFGNDRWNRRR